MRTRLTLEECQFLLDSIYANEKPSERRDALVNVLGNIIESHLAEANLAARREKRARTEERK